MSCLPSPTRHAVTRRRALILAFAGSLGACNRASVDSDGGTGTVVDSGGSGGIDAGPALLPPEEPDPADCIDVSALPSGQAPLSMGIDQIVASELYVVYSAVDKDSTTLPLRMDGTASIYVVRGEPVPGSNLREVLVFGAGYGNPNGVTREAAWNVLGRNYEVVNSSAFDAAQVDYVIQQCFGMSPERTKITFVAPHGHPDHINADLLGAVEDLGYPVADLSLYVATPDLASALDQNQDGAADLPSYLVDRITLLGPVVPICGDAVRDFPVASGTLRVISFPGHTDGTVNLLHVELDYLLLGSDIGECSQAGHADYFPDHGRARVGGAQPALTR